MDTVQEMLASSAMEDIKKRLSALEQKTASIADTNSLCMVVFSGELDKLLGAFVMATGAAACSMNVLMFFTFWGTAALKKIGPQQPGKSLVERMFGWMLPGGLHRRKLSRMDFGGLGRWMMGREMKKKQVPDLPTLIDLARELGVQLWICEMSMSLMGIRKEELIDYPGMQIGGVATFLEHSSRANTTLFI